MKAIALVVVGGLGLLILLEGALRWLLGLGKRPLYIADSEIGYLLAPDQTLRRFGKQMTINQYSMRSQAIDKQRPAGTTRLLLLGDSIANGAWWTDQQQTISALIEQKIRENSISSVEVLNASANSWGPRNQLAYLQRFGTFEAQGVILLLNTDDLFATAPTSLVVGRDRNYPIHQSAGALGEVLERLFVRPRPIPELAKVMDEKGDRVGINLAAIAQMQAIVTQSNAQFILAITPLLREVDGSETREYERKARQRLAEFTQTRQIPYIDFLSDFKAEPSVKSLYRDHIHLSPSGNQKVSTTLTQSLLLKTLVS